MKAPDDANRIIDKLNNNKSSIESTVGDTQGGSDLEREINVTGYSCASKRQKVKEARLITTSDSDDNEGHRERNDLIKRMNELTNLKF